jgi:hypothetical protein
MRETVISSILGASVGLAGILLVFVGFIYTRSEGFQVTSRAKKYQMVAKTGLMPFTVAIVCAWICLKWFATPTPSLYNWAVWSFQSCLILTGLYGIIALLFYI